MVKMALVQIIILPDICTEVLYFFCKINIYISMIISYYKLYTLLHNHSQTVKQPTLEKISYDKMIHFNINAMKVRCILASFKVFKIISLK